MSRCIAETIYEYRIKRNPQEKGRIMRFMCSSLLMLFDIVFYLDSSNCVVSIATYDNAAECSNVGKRFKC